MILNKRASRSIKHNIVFYIFSTILTILVVIFLIAAISTGKTLTKTLQDFMDTYKTEDAEFTTYVPMDDAQLEELEQTYDVTLEQSRYKDVAYGSATIRIFDMPDKVNLFDVRDGAMPEVGEALITEEFADAKGIKVGDTVDTEQGSYRISGFTTKADYIYMIQSLGSSYRDNDTFAVMIVGEADYEQIAADEICTYSIIYNKDNEKEVRKAIHETYMINSYMADTANTRISMPINQGPEVTSMAFILAPVLFIIVIALIVMIMGRRVKSEQSLLGTFLALGVSKKQIIGHYMMYGLLPGVLGSVLGAAASIPAVKMLAYLYIEYDFEPLPYKMHYDIPAIVCAFVLPSLLYCLASGFTAWKLLKKSPVDLLRHTGKDRRSIGILKNRRTKTAVKLRIRSVIGHPGRTIVTIIGVCIASLCIMVGFMMEDSMDDLFEHGITDSVTYKYMYTLNTLGEGAPEQGEGFFQAGYEVDGSIVTLSVVGIDADSKYFPNETKDGKKLDLEKITMTSAAASTYGVAVGDEITFMNTANLEEHTVTVDALVDDNAHSYIYTSRERAAEIAGLSGDVYNCIASDTKLELDKSIVAKETEVTDTIETMKSLTGLMDAICTVIKVLGLVLGIGILYLVINMIVEEGKTGISVMKVLGFSRGEISGRVLNVNHILVCIGYVLALPFSYEVVKAGYADTIENFGMQMSPIITAKSVILTFVFTWVMYEVSLWLQKRKISKIDMVEALKESNRDE